MSYRIILWSLFFPLAAVLLIVPALAARDVKIIVNMKPQDIRQGDAVLVRVSVDKKTTGISGKWRERTLSFFRDKEENSFSTLMGIDLDEAPGEKTVRLRITGSQGGVFNHPVTFLVLKKDFPVQRLTLPPGMVTLSPENLARARRERSAVDRLWDASSNKKRWSEAFVMPIEGTVLSPFGVKRILNNKHRSPHSGIDLRACAGAPVAATSGGTVMLAADHFFAGKSVYLDHGTGIVSMYFHLSKILVTEGEKVAGGQVIGLAGETGRASGPHLHWGVRIHGCRVDPLSLVKLFKVE